MAYHKVEIEFNGQPLTIETGKVARQADGAVIVTYGETKVLCTVVSARKMRAGQDFVAGDIKAEMEKRTNWGDLLSPDELEYPPAEEVKSVFHRPDW